MDTSGLIDVQNMLLTTAFFAKSRTPVWRTQLTKHRIGIFLRMDAESFKTLISPTIARQYTVMSRAVQLEQIDLP